MRYFCPEEAVNIYRSLKITGVFSGPQGGFSQGAVVDHSFRGRQGRKKVIATKIEYFFPESGSFLPGCGTLPASLLPTGVFP